MNTYYEKPKRKGKPLGRRAGILSVLFGLLIIVGIALYFTANQADIPISLTPIPALFILAGLGMIFADSLESKLNLEDELRDWDLLLSDDWEALRQGHLTKGVVMALIAVAGIAIETALIIFNHKWFALWGPINVIAAALVVSLVACYIGVKSGWFQQRFSRTPFWIFGVLMLGFVLSAGLGIYFTEPVEPGGPSQAQVNAVQRDTYEWGNTRASHITIFNSYPSSNGGSSASFSMPKCTGKGCGYAVLALVVIVLVIICVAGSALISHFWVLATILLLSIMAVFALRELLYYEETRKRKLKTEW